MQKNTPPPGNSDGADLLDQTIAVWQPYSDRPLSREDARQIVENVTGFFSVLKDWMSTELSESRPPPSSPSGRADFRGKTRRK